jgi:hypothetical protein
MFEPWPGPPSQVQRGTEMAYDLANSDEAVLIDARVPESYRTCLNRRTVGAYHPPVTRSSQPDVAQYC